MLKICILFALCCAVCISAEVPVNRFRNQRFRQAPQRQFLARQQAPYPDASAPEPDAAYGAPPKPTTPPASQYGPPPVTQYGAPPSAGDIDPNAEPVAEVEAEAFAGVQPSRLTAPSQLTAQKLTLPSTENAPKFAQRLELKQQVQLPPRQVIPAPLQYAQIQQTGSYYVQLPNGNIQRVNYVAQPDHVDNGAFAQLQFRPVAQAQAVVAEPDVFAQLQYRPVAQAQTVFNEPEVYVNTVVQSYTASE